MRWYKGSLELIDIYKDIDIDIDIDIDKDIDIDIGR